MNIAVYIYLLLGYLIAQHCTAPVWMEWGESDVDANMYNRIIRKGRFVEINQTTLRESSDMDHETQTELYSTSEEFNQFITTVTPPVENIVKMEVVSNGSRETPFNQSLQNEVLQMSQVPMADHCNLNNGVISHCIYASQYIDDRQQDQYPMWPVDTTKQPCEYLDSVQPPEDFQCIYENVYAANSNIQHGEISFIESQLDYPLSFMIPSFITKYEPCAS